jgi:acetyl/propionyl-CoA carboxylase alpha subunit
MFKRLLIANRGEVAIRIVRAAADLGVESVAVYTDDDAASLHVTRADRAVRLPGRGAAGYLDVAAVLDAAAFAECDAVHPGYGFLAENAGFARRAIQSGLGFIGPRPEILERFGDKLSARRLAAESGVPVLPGTAEAATLDQAQAFFAELPAGRAMVIKAVAGGGGRGMRVVRRADEVKDAFRACESEARGAFGNAELYVELLVNRARHLEVQIVGDRHGAVGHLWERECTLQRRHQKLVELAPSASLSDAERATLIDAAIAIARHVRYENLGTMEFLLNEDDASRSIVFIEANARLQVEHTVTEEVTGIDLVRAQLELAAGRSLAELGLDHPPPARGRAVQVRVNMETMQADGSTRPAGGTLTAFDVPTGRGVRVETFGYAGFTTSPAFDSLLAKVIVHEPGGDLARTLRAAERALGEFRIEGVPDQPALPARAAGRPRVQADAVYTRFVETEIAAGSPRRGADRLRIHQRGCRSRRLHGRRQRPARGAEAGPDGRPARPTEIALAEGLVAVPAPMQGTIVGVDVAEGDSVQAGQQLMVMEAMKMEHVISAPVAGIVRGLAALPGDTLFEGHRLLAIEPRAEEARTQTLAESFDLELIRPDLAEARQRHAYGQDENRPDAVARRHGRGHRTARENVADLVDPGSFVEYGPLMLAAQRRRRSVQDLMEKTSGDGMVAGIGTVNGELFGREHSRVMAMSYDYMVLAGTQGHMNHLKKDRLFRIAEENQLPVVLFAEGGGGRPGDTDGTGVAGLDCYAFNYFARLSGLAPLVGITNGYCFAGNAALLGCCDVIIATEGSNIGMGGPAMVEGGGLGVYRPDEIGPLDVHIENGVVDIAVKDEAEAVDAAKRYLGYFPGPAASWSCEDQRILRHLIPENRLRVYDVRRVIEYLADTDSVLELRRGYGVGMVTALARVEGRPLGILANNPAHLGGAIDSPAADKAARFIQLCDAFDIPMLFLCDTPGFMVGPEAEKSAQVRRFARMFVTAPT